ncbi:hypothetical protein BC941DRAFT_509192 [Chlamydoabsidia padenii]|nr:hypothetical protein BC941DRAFT_509192 [Chlamydoabsidia padenii]
MTLSFMNKAGIFTLQDLDCSLFVETMDNQSGWEMAGWRSIGILPTNQQTVNKALEQPFSYGYLEWHIDSDKGTRQDETIDWYHSLASPKSEANPYRGVVRAAKINQSSAPLPKLSSINHGAVQDLVEEGRMTSIIDNTKDIDGSTGLGMAFQYTLLH